MRRRRWIVVSAFLALLLSGCATAPQVVSLSPQVHVTGARQGGGQAVALSVVDERGYKRLLGYRAASNANLNSAILNDRDVSTAIRQALAKGLRQEGFVPSDSPPSGGRPSLVVHIQQLRYRQVGSDVMPVARIRVVLSAKASNGPHSYSATYRVLNKDPLGVLNTRTAHQRVINKAVESALQQVLDDSSLTAVLRGQSG